MQSSDVQTAIEAEIRALHADLAAWLSGRCAQDEVWFETAFAAKFHPSFFNVQPAGRKLERQQLLDDLRDGYGVSPAFDILIRTVEQVQVLASGTAVLATYDEYQKGAKNSRPNNARLSTVLFDVADDGSLVWRAIHETWLPEDRHDPSLYAF